MLIWWWRTLSQGSLPDLTFLSVCAKSLQSCPTLCDPMDCRPPSSSVHEILQARILDWVVMPFSGQSSWPRDQTHVSCTADRFLPLGPSGEPVNSLYWIPLHFVVFVHFKVLLKHLSMFYGFPHKPYSSFCNWGKSKWSLAFWCVKKTNSEVPGDLWHWYGNCF